MADSYTQPFIGKFMSVVASANTDLISLQGIVLDETKFSFLLKTEKGEKRVLKSGTIFSCQGDIINGYKIIKRLDERIKLRGK